MSARFARDVSRPIQSSAKNCGAPGKNMSQEMPHLSLL